MDVVLQRTISQSRRSNDILRKKQQRMKYAYFVYAIRQDDSKALKLLKDLTSEYLTSPPVPRYFYWDDNYSREQAYALLIRLYLCKALRAPTTDLPTSIIELNSLLEKLSTLETQSAEKEINEKHGALGMGTWLSVQGQQEQAKTWLRKAVLEGIRQLSNSESGGYRYIKSWYIKLAEALLHFGDK